MTEFNPDDLTTKDIEEAVRKLHIATVDEDLLAQGAAMMTAANALNAKNQLVRKLAQHMIEALSRGGLLHKDTLDHTKKLESLVKGLEDAIKELEMTREKAKEMKGDRTRLEKDVKELIRTIEIFIYEIDEEKQLIARRLNDEAEEMALLTTAVGKVLGSIGLLHKQAIESQKKLKDDKQIRAFQEYIDHLSFILQYEEKLAAMVQTVEFHTRNRLKNYWQEQYRPHLADLERVAQQAIEEVNHPSDLIEFKVVLSKERAVAKGLDADQTQLEGNIKTAVLGTLNAIHSISKQERSIEVFINLLRKTTTSVANASKWV